MKINKSVHLTILFVLAFVLITACLTVTYLLDEQSNSSQGAEVKTVLVDSLLLDALQDAANEADPKAESNTAHECRLAPTGVYYNSSMGWYVVTCVIQNKENVYGVVFIERGVVVNIDQIDAMSQVELESTLESDGYSK